MGPITPVNEPSTTPRRPSPARESPPIIGRTNDLFSLGNCTVVITGGGRGLGIVLAGAVIEAGGDVVYLDLLPHAQRRRVGVCAKAGRPLQDASTHRTCRVDITDAASTEHILEQIAPDALSPNMTLRGLVICAGIQHWAPALDYSVELWRKMLDVNVIGTFTSAKHCARIFKEQNFPASIVLIASMSGHIANRGLTCTAYNSSKASVHRMCRSVAREWGQYDIRINTLSAGYIRTARTFCFCLIIGNDFHTWR
ncbi:NAD(P)-binding protein [Aspergillus saccharolyticus JOP 1030-1]|uniref:NAD(P)-binding protein n=1 Tax=Aspergillus saccharolyticus JOP 1030-1 TaxID=1450539 RepID=A0A318Z0C1_9EURO|nr:NAD(P)-binding protein [Aspergillus saccharolyticus JOP 1030-1]PYH40731.1 NAD(P)-binding protein [Aspergillus saccharolyticus JOP 1030-1]